MKPLRVFTDFHHASLLNSIIMLFEGRLGGEVYRPIGMEWAERGFWKVYDHPATQAQFLSPNAATPDNTPRLNDIVYEASVASSELPVMYHCRDIENGGTNKAITLDGFLNSHFDIVIASIPQHIEPFLRLCDIHPDHPKLIYQIGNSWPIDRSIDPKRVNIMASAMLLPHQTAGYHVIEYHQEFDTKIFHPVPPDVFMPKNTVYSFVNCFGVDGLFAFDWALFQEVEKLMLDEGWAFGSFGGQCRDGAAHGSQQMADFMRASKFIWHTKQGGDGYGHVLHNSAAVGRPLIAKKYYYLGKLGLDLIQDGETAIVIDGLGPEEIANKIRYYSEPARWSQMCNNVITNFRNVCDFDNEFLSIKQFVSELL